MIVVLKPGEKVEIQFAESDGEITVAFHEERITVETDWPDTAGRQGVIYEEIFGYGISDKIAVVEWNEPVPENPER